MLRDEGVSRRHARIVQEGHGYVLEDLGSANGTRVNGTRLTQPRELKSGDTLSIGPVLFVFERVAPPNKVANEETRLLQSYTPGQKVRIHPGRRWEEDQAPELENEPTVFGMSGRARDLRLSASMPSLQPRGRVPGSGAAPEHEPTTAETESRVDAAPEAGDETSPLAPRTPPPRPSARSALDDETSPLAPRTPMPSAAVEHVQTTEAEVARRSRRMSAVGQAPVGAGPGGARAAAAASAAERARLRREAGDTLGGHLRLFWLELSGGGRLVVGGVLAAVVLAALGAVAFAFWPQLEALGPRGPEPDRLSREPLPDSFGLGEGVSWTRPDMKVFRFEFVSPTRAVAVLHLQARDISPDEVAVFLNGAEQGMLPADVGEARDRYVELVLPPRHLNRNAENQLVLDNLKNPPGADSWRVENLRLEVIPIPELSPEETRRKAEELAEQGRKSYELRDVGSDNLFKAWKSYRYAWLTLEALEQKPELHLFVRDSLGRISRELDVLCSRLLLDVHRSLQLKNKKRARQTLGEVSRYFPTPEHRCHQEAERRLAELGF